MIWLLLSILCSTLIFVIFRLFGHYKVNNLQAIVVNYGVAGGLGLLIEQRSNPLEHILQQPWLWSILIIGFLFIALFQVMALVSQKLGVAAVSVAVKMSLIMPVVFGIVYYGESFTLLKISAVALALVAVILASYKPEQFHTDWRFMGLPLLLFLGSGFLDIFLNYNEKELVADADQLLFTSGLFAMAGLFGLVWLSFRWMGTKHRWSLKSLWGGIALGIPNLGSIYFLLRALDFRGLESSVIFPVNHVGIVLLSAVTGIFAFREKPSILNYAGIILAMIAILMISATI